MDDYLSRKIKILSLFAIGMVVYVHAYNLGNRYLLPWTPIAEPLGAFSFIEYFVSNGLTRFAVPLFFAVSGYLFFRTLTPDPVGFAEKFVKRLRSLGIPFVFWSAWGLAWAWGLQQSDATRPAVDSWDIRSGPATIAWFVYRLFAVPVPFQLWFLRDLMLYVLLSPLIYGSLRYLSFVALAPPFIAWFFHFDVKIMEAEGILFFMLGGWLAIREVTPPRNIPRTLPVALLTVWIGLLIAKTLFSYEGNPYATPGYLVPLHKIAILCGFFGIWWGYDLIGERVNSLKTLMALTPLTFFVYAAHEPLLNFLSNYALFQIGMTPETQLTVFLAAPLATIALCLLSGAALRFIAPPVFGIITGGRG